MTFYRIKNAKLILMRSHPVMSIKISTFWIDRMKQLSGILSDILKEDKVDILIKIMYTQIWPKKFPLLYILVT